MKKEIAYILLIISAISLIIDLIFHGLNFYEGRIYRNVSSVLIIIVAVITIKNLKE